ncbi:MIP/aquaporin family protein [Sodalis sp. RH21]|uniref:MIP/aquaporin family protein n=1 Tax=unclassified Sodalis (in: enterobacteria) TaxID=2636512 RepID=UPI0039B641B4
MSIFSPSLKCQCFAEFLGTGLFLFLGISCLAASRLAGASFGLWEICIVWGLSVSLGVYLTAGISGGHLNPAVSIALWLFGNFDRKKVLPYIVAQTLGAFGGAMVAYLLYYNLFIDFELAHHIQRGSMESLAQAGIFSTYPHASINLVQAFASETIGTLTLMCLIMALTDDGNGVPRGPLAPLLIGVSVAIIGVAIGALTGFALNPARDFGPRLFSFLAGWGDVSLTGGRDIPYFIIPIIAPIVGACIGAALYRGLIGKLRPGKARDEHSDSLPRRQNV